MTERLQRVTSAEQLPLIPTGLDPETRRYIENLHNYLRRLSGKLISDNIVPAIINNPAFITYVQTLAPDTITVISAIQFNTSTGTLEYKTKTFKADQVGDESAWTPFGEYTECE